MTENSSSEVGRAAIDAYLDSVEQALLVAHAPRGDRVQVLQDLELQIVDMLASGPQPLTEEIVQSTLAKLEPPSHFAAMYGNGKESRAAWVDKFARQSAIRWPLVAALSCVCLGFGCLGVLLTNGPNEPGGGVTMKMLLVGFVLTPFALWRAVKQVRVQSGHPRDRELVVKSALVYCVVASVLVMVFIMLATHGMIFFLVGLAAFVYLVIMMVRRLNRYLSETLPRQTGGDACGHAAAPAVGGAMSMPAV